MPKQPIDYSKCVMYRIVCNDLNITDSYIGHTTNLTQRRHIHKNDYKLYENRKLYKCIKENNGFDNWSIIEIEKYPCKSYDEAVSRERYWIEHYKATLNTAPITERKKCIKCGNIKDTYNICANCPYQYTERDIKIKDTQIDLTTGEEIYNYIKQNTKNKSEVIDVLSKLTAIQKNEYNIYQAKLRQRKYYEKNKTKNKENDVKIN